MNERDIFLGALAKADPAERAAYLDAACKDDDGLRQRLDILLDAHARAQQFLENPAAAAVTLDQTREPLPGTLIAGRYKLRERIGEGGMGAVWVAEQVEPVRRKVALKLIKPGMDSRQVLSRFEAERQALALMDHPNIAKVLDGGVTDEVRPFFAMEYVKGIPITQYCDDAKVPIPQRLKLFVQVCHAVQHAHQKGIIHRDLKPSNILVCLYDGEPVPKVIDFGLAKAMHQPLTEHTLYTAHGMMLGTPLYMSPEQAELNNLDVDTRTDIYSLGVILYELLTGTTPLEKHRFKEAAFQEVLRLIKEEEPPQPSLRLSTSEHLALVAAQRCLEPAQLSRAVEGELDWIVMKALDKERSRRYETANALALDVQRHLGDEPVSAGPPSNVYRLRKFLRRHRGPATAVAIVLVSLLAGIAGTGWGLKQARDRLAETVAAKAEADHNLYVADVQRAAAAFQDGNLRETRRLLDIHEQSRRGEFEFRLLRELSRRSHAAREYETSAIPLAGDVSADGRFIGVCQRNGMVRVIDQRDRSERMLRTEPIGGWLDGFYVSFAPDNRHVAFPDIDQSCVRIRNLEDGQEVSFPNRADSVLVAAFCPNTARSWLATGDENGGVRVWDWTRQKVVAERQFQGVTKALAWSSDGKRLAFIHAGRYAAMTFDGVTVLEPEGNKIVWPAPPSRHLMDRGMLAIAIAPSGTRIAVSFSNHTVKVWDLVSDELIATFAAHGKKVDAIRFLSDTRIASGGRDNVIRVWDLSSLREQRSLQEAGDESSRGEVSILPSLREQHLLRGHSGQVWWLAGPTPEGYLVSGGWDNRVMLWQLNPGTEKDSITFDAIGTGSCALSPDQSIVATVVRDGVWSSHIEVLNVPGFARRGTLKTNYAIGTVAISAQGKLACGGRSSDGDFNAGFVTIWESIADNKPRTFGKLRGYASQIAFAPDGNCLAVSRHHGCAVIDLRDGQSHELAEGVFVKIAWSPDGRYLAAGRAHAKQGVPRLLVWHADTHRLKFDSRGPDDHTDFITCVAFSPDSKRLASGCLDGQIHLRDVATGHRNRQIPSHAAVVWQVAFSNDGRYLFSGDGIGMINVWDLERNELRLSFPAHTDGTGPLVVSRDDSFLISGGVVDATIRFWRIPR